LLRAARNARHARRGGGPASHLSDGRFPARSVKKSDDRVQAVLRIRKWASCAASSPTAPIGLGLLRRSCCMLAGGVCSRCCVAWENRRIGAARVAHRPDGCATVQLWRDRLVLFIVPHPGGHVFRRAAVFLSVASALGLVRDARGVGLPLPLPSCRAGPLPSCSRSLLRMFGRGGRRLGVMSLSPFFSVLPENKKKAAGPAGGRAGPGDVSWAAA